MTHQVQIAIAVGWGVRGLALLLALVLSLLRSDSRQSRILLHIVLLLAFSLVGPVAEYHDLALRYARLAEVAVSSLVVSSAIALLFKLHPPAALDGMLMMGTFTVLYTLAAATTSASLEAALLIVGAACAVRGLLSLRASVPRSFFVENVCVSITTLFYIIVMLQTILGPWVLDYWGRQTWAIVWEVSITLYYLAFSTLAWFNYTPSTPDLAYASDWFDAATYWASSNRWAEPESKKD